MTMLNIRLTGLTSLLAGICMFSGGVLHGIFHNPFGHWIMYWGYLLVILALSGLYGCQARQTGLLGLLGYILSSIGAMIVSVAALLVLAEVSGSEEAHTVFMFMYSNLALYLPSLYALLLGFVIFGIASVYGRVFPRWSGMLFALAAVVDLPAELSMSLSFMYYISVFLTMISLSWMGVHLLVRGQQISQIS